MSKLNNIYRASTSLRFIALLLVLTICISTTSPVNGLVDEHDENTDGEWKTAPMPEDFLSLKTINTQSYPSSIISDYDDSHGHIYVIPFKKRTIPIELQKALYAHGIVGRRRRR